MRERGWSGSDNHLPAVDRLVWLLPLLERVPDDGVAALVKGARKLTPFRRGRILTVVATLEDSRSCDGRQRPAGTGAADGQA